MKRTATSVLLVAGILATTACNRTQPDLAQIVPDDRPSTVTMTDGSRYRGALVSKNGSQMTFRGDNGATRTLDSRDIRSLRLEDAVTTGTRGDRVSRPALNPGKPVESIRSKATIPSGTQISVRNNEAINSKNASAGQTFSAVIASDILDTNGVVAIPRGSDATLMVRRAGAGKVRANELALELSSITLRGIPHDVQTGILVKKEEMGSASTAPALFSGGGRQSGR
ncbi:MAG: hypothetical protein WKF37_07460 [Bryobacteraceae bacterium]